MPVPFYLRFLQREFERKKGKNKKYTLKNFSQYLNLDFAVLTKVFHRREALDESLGESLVAIYDMDDSLAEKFLRSIQEDLRIYKTNLVAPAPIVIHENISEPQHV